MNLRRVVEALVFASPKPLLTKEIVAALRASAAGSENEQAKEFAKAKEDDIVQTLQEIQEELIGQGRAFQIVERVNGWTFVSDADCALWVRQLYPEAKPTRLTGPQLETLAIIAYRQPVTRADIEAVRGVAVDGVMQVLLDRGLVKIAGRADVPGRPLLYSTTEYFLEHFGLKTTDELPNASELKRVVLPAAPAPEKAAPEGEAKAAPEAEAPPAGDAPESSGLVEPAAEASAAEEPAADLNKTEPDPEPAGDEPVQETEATPAETSAEARPEEQS